MPDNDDVRAQAEQMRQTIGAAIEQIGRDLKNFHDKAKEAAGSSGGFAQLNTLLGGMTKNLVGPLGMAAGFIAVGRAFTEFIDQRAKLSLFAKDIGLSTENVYNMQRAMFLAGKEFSESAKSIGAIGTALKDLDARRWASSIYHDLIQLGPQFADLGNKLVALRGHSEEQIKLIAKTWKDGSPQIRTLIEQTFHVSASDIEIWTKEIDPALNQRQQEIAERYDKQVREWRIKIKDAWEYALGGALEALEKADKFYTAPMEGKEPTGAPNYNPRSGYKPPLDITPDTQKGWYRFLHPTNPRSGGRQAGGPVSAGEPYVVGEAGPELFVPAQYGQIIPSRDGGGALNDLRGAIDAGLTFYERARDWINETELYTTAGRRVGETEKSSLYKMHQGMRFDLESALDMTPAGSWALFGERFLRNRIPRTGGGGGFGVTGSWGEQELVNVEQDSNKVLLDIRDILQRMEGGGGGDGAGSYGKGIRGPNFSARIGGFRGGVHEPPTADPRGLGEYIKETAKKYGIDPDTALRVAQSEGLRDFYGDNNTSFGAFQAHIGGGLGDEYRKETGRDPADPSNERDLIDWQLKRASREGWGPYHGAARVGVGRMTGIGGNPGYRAGAGGAYSIQGQRPSYYGGIITMDGQQYHYGTGGAGASAPYGVYPITPGAEGPIMRRIGGIALNNNTVQDPLLGRRDGIALHSASSSDLDRLYSQGCFAVSREEWPAFKARLMAKIQREGPQYLTVRRDGSASISPIAEVEDDRRKIDRTVSGNGERLGSVAATVDFKNAPSWVRTSVTSEGKFLDLRVSRSTPQNARSEASSTSDPSTWAY